MSDIALSVRGLTKEYKILHNAEKHNRVTDAVASSVKGLFKKTEVETFKALDDVSFDVKKGEVLGVIGRNGAGKSTLLKILSRITEPSSGEIHLYGRVGSLLEVGTGFHPELTGRENIFLNGAILGMRKREIERQFDAIVDFAEVEKFLDTPVKRYSSGMYVRLAFAVAAHLNPEILIVDEVLAVGDAQFQKKCLGKMQDVSREGGRTVLVVSHNPVMIQALCTQCLLLKQGTLEGVFSPHQAMQEYASKAVSIDFNTKSHTDKPTIIAIDYASEGRAHVAISGSDLTLQVTYNLPKPILLASIEIRVLRDDATIVTLLNSEIAGNLFSLEAGTHRFNCTLPKLALTPGEYTLDVLLFEGQDGYSKKSISTNESALLLTVTSGDFFKTGKLASSKYSGSFFQDQIWETTNIKPSVIRNIATKLETM